MIHNIYFYNDSKRGITINGFYFPPFELITHKLETGSLVLREIRKHKYILQGNEECLRKRLEIGGKKMQVNIMNKAHWTINVGRYSFKPYKETSINVGSCDSEFKAIRSNKNLRVGKTNNEHYIKSHKLVKGLKYNFIFDVISQHEGAAYIHAIEALANPIKESLPKKEAAFFNRPAPGPKGKGINCRFFNSARIAEHGKCPVGPNDVFISHGIGDKDYWTAKKIKAFNYAFVPGPTWEARMRATGYKGEIFVVGYTKLDPIFQGKYEKTKRDKPYIAWLPTHGYSNKHRGRSSYPQFLQDIPQIPLNIYDLCQGMHPTTKLHSCQKQVPTMQELVDADVVIADAGSTLYEAWAVGKPVIFPDWICKKDVLGHFGPDNLEYKIYKEGIGYHAKDMAHMLQLIEVALKDGMGEREKEFIEGIFPGSLRGTAGKTAADALIEISNTFN